MNCKPCVVIASATSTKPKSLIKLLTKHPLDDVDASCSKIVHPWKLQTKYYDADVDLVGITEDFNRDADFNDSVEALVVHLDSNRESGLADVETWTPLETDCDPEVKLLLTNYCDADTKVTRAAATSWCLGRGYELIELYPRDDVEKLDDGFLPEKVGVERAIEALQAHVWPNLRRVDEDNDEGGGDAADDFTDLFNNVISLRDSIKSLSGNDRLECAEQVVTAFWRALGGDEEEIADL